MEAVVLAGGLGTRLRSACPDIPKPLAPVQGKPFLSHLMTYWKSQGITRFILSVGYLHEKIIDTYGDTFEGVSISYAIEKTPLGTGGALLHALPLLKMSSFLVLNGDTLFQVPLKDFSLKGDCTIALHSVEKNTRYGGVTLSIEEKIVAFSEPTSTLINGGCYLFCPSAIRTLEKKPLSLEKEVIPNLNCFGQVFDRPFIDIGISEDLKRFQEALKRGKFANRGENLFFNNGL